MQPASSRQSRTHELPPERKTEKKPGMARAMFEPAIPDQSNGIRPFRNGQSWRAKRTFGEISSALCAKRTCLSNDRLDAAARRHRHHGHAAR